MGGTILASQAPSIAILINRVAGVGIASIIVANVPTKAKRVSRRHHRLRSEGGIAGPPGVVPKHPERRTAAGRQPSIYNELNEAAERWGRARTCPSIGTASWGILTPGVAEILSRRRCATDGMAGRIDLAPPSLALATPRSPPTHDGENRAAPSHRLSSSRGRGTAFHPSPRGVNEDLRGRAPTEGWGVRLGSLDSPRQLAGPSRGLLRGRGLLGRVLWTRSIPAARLLEVFISSRFRRLIVIPASAEKPVAPPDGPGGGSECPPRDALIPRYSQHDRPTGARRGERSGFAPDPIR
ncbi:hypothetical protein THAOC_06921, partial [Thalassiosira oceanica]